MKCGKTLRDKTGWLEDPVNFVQVKPVNAFPGAYKG
jgi:hypothetical protein